MAEKSSELTKDATNDGAILSQTDKDAISAVAGAYDNDDFVENHSDDPNSSADRDARAATTATDDADTGEDATEETEHLRAQIEETRSQMGDTIDAIQERLSFQNISEQVKEQVSEQITSAFETAKETVYDATIKKAGKFMNSMNKTINEGLDGISNSNAVSVARQNPLALSLIGLGIGLLLMNGYRSGSKSSRRYSYGNGGVGGRDYRQGGYASTGESSRANQPSMLKSAQGAITDTASSAYGSVSNAASGAYDSVTNVAGGAYDRVSSAAGSAVSGVSSAATSAYSGVTSAAGTAYEKVGEFGTQAREQYDYYIEENPLAVGAVALALGAAVGMALPSTRVENQLMGEKKQELLSLAQERAGDLVDRVKQVAGEAQKTITDEVKTQTQELKR